MTRAFETVALTALLVAAGACKKEQPPEKTQPAATASASAQAEGEETADDIFKTRCTQCHGADGKGDGPGAAALNPKPRNYTDPTWQASVTDDQIKKTIVQGGAAVGKSAAMPPNPDLEDKPEVVDGLVKIIRGFKGK